MSLMKRYLENLSVELGYDGAITDEVMAIADRHIHPERVIDVEVATCVGCGNDFCYDAKELSSVPDLCKQCATIALEEGFSGYVHFVNAPSIPYYVNDRGEAIPLPEEE